MNERSCSEKLMAAMRDVEPGSVVRKLSDRATVGIPDIIWGTFDGLLLVEVKYVRVGQNLYTLATKGPSRQQLHECREWERVNDRCYYVAFYEKGPMQIWRPSAIGKGAEEYQSWIVNDVAKCLAARAECQHP